MFTARFEHSVLLRVFLLFVLLVLCLCLQLAGITHLIDGQQGDRDSLKQRIGYWATGCAILYAFMMHFLGRWFTKDIFWRWGTGMNTWGITPSLWSVTLIMDIGGLIGSILALSMVLTFLASVFLNIWLTTMTRISPYQTLGGDQIYNISGISYFDAPAGVQFTDTAGQAFNSILVQSAVGSLEKLKMPFYNDRYYWLPFYKNSTPSTILVENITSFSIQPKCKGLEPSQFNISTSIDIIQKLNMEVQLPCGNFSLESGRNCNGYWNLCIESEYSDTTISAYFIETIHHGEFFGPATWKNPAEECYLYLSKCDIPVETWHVDAYLNSFEVTRSQIVQALPYNYSSEGDNIHISNYISSIVRSLDTFANRTSDNSDVNDYRTPLWRYLVGWNNQFNTTNIGDWVENRLANIVASTLTDSIVAVTSYNVTGKMILNISIAEVNRTGLIAGVLVQLVLVGVIIGLYMSRDGNGFHSDDVDYLLKSQGDEVREELMRL